ncbi:MULTISPECIES: DUF2795 domain-containing protein [Pseudomonas]|jgi:hypothetical protein|uniref:DUF2795 domain-containing protein n=1 Tax=Pseudomonas indica TaxID=137658 RepID=A0A1G9IP92_9PSED|nr:MULTISPECIES: DUF2795 domain-containing protein [Pseudomonas]MBU3059186.1 DUF2795 domain-containing protein [Pseudomonas indica]PAU59978.1 hypothetical protein BZL41_16120 [Pseudomonas sp. PIC25]PAU63776.1 hypothetical protein BZL42_03680 [Pseudomonas indica]SDL26971.1 Protein of unknown function [Pseudomonas indica]
MTRGLGGSSPANVSQYLKGVGFPATKQRLLEQAERNGAQDEVLNVLRKMPEAQYDDMAGVMKGFGQVE